MSFFLLLRHLITLSHVHCGENVSATITYLLPTHNHPKESIVFFITHFTHIYAEINEWAERKVKYPVERLDECLMLKISFIFITTHSKISQYLSQARKKNIQKNYFRVHKACLKSFIHSLALTWLTTPRFYLSLYGWHELRENISFLLFEKLRNLFCSELEKIYFAPQASY